MYDNILKSPIATTQGSYMVLHTGVQHVTAHLVCSIIGHLVVIGDQNELDQLNQTGYHWIDRNDIQTEGTWISSFTQEASFESWAPGEPSTTHGDSEDCGIKKDNLGMGDAPCSSKNSFICEV